GESSPGTGAPLASNSAISWKEPCLTVALMGLAGATSTAPSPGSTATAAVRGTSAVSARVALQPPATTATTNSPVNTLKRALIPGFPITRPPPSCGVRPGWCGGARTPLYRAVNRANGTNAHRVVSLTPFRLPTSLATTHLVCEGWRPTATPAVHSSTTEEPAERNDS